MTIKAVLTVSDHHEMVTIHRAIMELKRVTNPSDAALVGSPILAKFSNRLLDAIIQYEEENFGSDRATRWEEWRMIDESRTEWSQMKQHIENVDNWSQMPLFQKREYVKNLASPFVLKDAQVEFLICIQD